MTKLTLFKFHVNKIGVIYSLQDTLWGDNSRFELKAVNVLQIAKFKTTKIILHV